MLRELKWIPTQGSFAIKKIEILKVFTEEKRMKILKRGAGCLCCICIFLIASTLVSACGRSSADRWQEQYDLGQQYLLEENYEEAIVAFTAAIEIDPKQADAYLGRGDAYILSGETEEHLSQAMADYRQVLKLDEKNISAYLRIADVYIRQRDYDAALEILNEGLTKTGDNEEIKAQIAEIESGNITDSSGNVRRMSSYDASGALMWYHDYTYDEEGRQASITSYDASGSQTGYVELAYDEAGQKLVTFCFPSTSGEVGSWVFERDTFGNAVRETFYDAQGSMTGYYVNQYDSAGNQILSERYDSEGDLIGTTEHEYDEQGNEIRISYYMPDG